jgi:hypothetical protein
LSILLSNRILFERRIPSESPSAQPKGLLNSVEWIPNNYWEFHLTPSKEGSCRYHNPTFHTYILDFTEITNPCH